MFFSIFSILCDANESFSARHISLGINAGGSFHNSLGVSDLHTIGLTYGGFFQWQGEYGWALRGNAFWIGFKEDLHNFKYSTRPPGFIPGKPLGSIELKGFTLDIVRLSRTNDRDSYYFYSDLVSIIYLTCQITIMILEWEVI